MKALALIPLFVLAFALIPQADASPALRDENGKLGCWWCEDKAMTDPIRPFLAENLPSKPTIGFATSFSSFELNVPETIKCDTWVPITGQVPDTGILMSFVTSGEHIEYRNLSSSPNHNLVNYLNVPCGNGNEGTVSFTFQYNVLKDHEFSPNTKVVGDKIDRVHLFHSETFKVVQPLD